MDAIELGVLHACREMTQRQREILPLLAEHLRVPESELLYVWARRQCPQHGRIAGSDWTYFFHGYECDLRQASNGRFLRIDFGPGGQTDTVTAWGVLQFTMTTAAPWAEFPELRAFFAKEGPPFNEFSGDMSKMSPVWERLESAKAFEVANKGLVDLLVRFTCIEPSGLRRVQFPAETPERRMIDCMVAHRQRLSPYGRRLLETSFAQSRG